MFYLPFKLHIKLRCQKKKKKIDPIKNKNLIRISCSLTNRQGINQWDQMVNFNEVFQFQEMFCRNTKKIIILKTAIKTTQKKSIRILKKILCISVISYTPGQRKKRKKASFFFSSHYIQCYKSAKSSMWWWFKRALKQLEQITALPWT